MEPNTISFCVESVDRIVVTNFNGFECRPECSLELLCDLVQNWPELLVGIRGGISFRDFPPGREWIQSHEFAFSATKRVGEPTSCLPFPCPYTLRWPQVGIPNAEAMMHELLADTSPYESDKIFWIGANSHPSRSKLCELGRMHPELFDVEIIEWDNKASGGQVSKTRQVSILDHRKFKYLVDCPGNGYSARVKWLLATGRPIFMVERNVVEHWHEDMEPWVHYAPVAADLSNLIEHHSRLEEDPALYEKIGKNARQFAAEHLTIECLLNRTAEAIWQARQRTKVPLLAPSEGAMTSIIKIVTVYSDNVLPLYENFATSLNAEANGLLHFSRKFDITSTSGQLGFQSDSWYKMLAHQVEYVLHVMTHDIEDGEFFIVSDIDIHFFKPEKLHDLVMASASGDFEFTALLDGDRYYNCGFIILKKCPKIIELYRLTLENLAQRRRHFADQDEINEILPMLGIKHRPISPKIGVLGKQSVHEVTVFYHATFAGDLENKLARIEFAKAQMKKHLEAPGTFSSPP
jgi:hypothetical protein